MSSKRSLLLSDAHDLISKKILINNMSIQLAKHQMLYSASAIKMQQYAINISKERTKLLKQVNELMEKQLNEFDETRHKECMDIYGYIDDLEKSDDVYKKCIEECNKHEEAIKNLIPSIDAIEKTIPNEQVITNYKISEKPIAPTAYSCATEIAAFGTDQSPPGPPPGPLPE